MHIWTLRAENQFMATNFRRGTDPNATGDLYAEALAFLDAGVDGISPTTPTSSSRRATTGWWRLGRQSAGAAGCDEHRCKAPLTSPWSVKHP